MDLHYQLELANGKIKELSEKLLHAESNLIGHNSEMLATIETQQVKIEQLTIDIARYERSEREHQISFELREDDNFKTELYIRDMQSALQAAQYRLDEYLDYIGKLEDQNIMYKKELQDVKQRLYHSKENSKYNNNKEYAIQLIEAQDKIIQLQKQARQKENYNSQNTSILQCKILEDKSNQLSYKSEKSISVHSDNKDQLFELQNELNRNIKLLNSKLKHYSSK